MNDLREAAQQALEAWENHLGMQGLRAAINNLRAALAQQDEALNLSDPAVRKRLAAQWGYVPAAQAEPVEPAAWLAPDGSVRETPAAKSFGEWVWGPDDFKPLYTAPPPPQRKPLTKESLLYIYNQLPNWGMDMDSLPQGLEKFARAVEQAHGIKE